MAATLSRKVVGAVASLLVVEWSLLEQLHDLDLGLVLNKKRAIVQP